MAEHINSVLRTLVDQYERTQRDRIRHGNHLAAIDRGDAKESPAHRQLIEAWYVRFQELEKLLEADIKAEVKHEPIYDMLKGIKGIGPILAAKMVAQIDIHRAPTVSALWRYAGYAVIDGERERPRKGEKLSYNIRLKTACYLAATSFLKANSPYRRVYDDAREYYAANRPDWTPAHQHLAAMRKMTKVFLSHMWGVWRAIEGLPTRALYVMEYLGHSTEYKAVDFGWPELIKEAA